MRVKRQNKIFVWGLIGVVIVLLFVLSVSYAYWMLREVQKNANIITTECFHLTFEEQSNSNIQLLDAYPISDEDGKKLTPYTFRITNQCKMKAKYTLRLELDEISTMDSKYVKVMLNQNPILKLNEFSEINPIGKNVKVAYLMEEMTILPQEEKSYEFRLWLDGGISSDNMEVMNRLLEAKITVDGEYDSSYTESLLNGADPVLKDGLIPVTIAANGEVKKANLANEWYRYETKNWANAVILEDESILYEDGDVIPESNIESYFVWIPRYRYQIFNQGLYYGLSENSDATREIQIVFETKKDKIFQGTKEGEWLTHPAFTAFDVNGLWVGKFETGYKGATISTEAEHNEQNPSKVQIKPNVYSWRTIDLAHSHLNSFHYKREYDSHLMKNTEWGAVAYLSHSKYGVMAPIRINNNSSYLTGYGSVIECEPGNLASECMVHGTSSDITVPYQEGNGLKASSTGNIMGIYDMSGGAHEGLMGVMSDKHGRPFSGRSSQLHSGFNGPLSCPTCDNDTSGITEITNGIDFPAYPYYDLYAYSEDTFDATRRILGDATGELGGFKALTSGSYTRGLNSWYQSDSFFITAQDPFFYRGYEAQFGTKAGIFQYTSATGTYFNGTSFRIVLAI